jgi:GT2 family glycosyltransferase
MSEPLVTIIVVTYNSMKIKHILDEALDHLFKIEYRPVEIIIVDNGSSDGTFEYLREFVSNKAPKDIQIKLLKLSKNYGFAVANNIGFAFRDRRSKYVALINNDLAVEPRTLELLIDFLEKHVDVGGVQGKILSWDGNKIDSAGCFLDEFFGTYTLCQGLPVSTCNRLRITGYLDGAFAIYRVSALLNASRVLGSKNLIFIPYFFMYGDDYELSTRLWRMGYKPVYLPVVVGRHYRSATVKAVRSPVYEYWGWKSEIAIRVVYDKWIVLKILGILPAITLMSLFSGRKVVLSGLINGVLLGFKLRKKYPQLNKLRSYKLMEPRVNLIWKLSSIPLIVRAFVKFGAKATRALYLIASRYYLPGQDINELSSSNVTG